MTRTALGVAVLSTTFLAPRAADAQTLGTFRWQLQPYCNVVTVTVVQDGGQYHLDGTDDQCGATRKASVVGLAFPNPIGTIGFGLTIVTTPGGAPVHVDAEIAIATVSGTWRDSAGATGTFAFTTGAGTGGSPRPPATAAIPPAFLLAPSGNFLAKGFFGGAGSIPASGPGARMMWYPAEAAFRVGRVAGQQWDAANIGSHSTASGLDTIASGDASTAMGSGSAAGGSVSTAMGSFTQAIGASSTAMGGSTLAEGDYSTAMGSETRATGRGSTAMGISTLAQGNFSTAMGDGAVAAGHRSTAMGLNTLAGGALSLAAGSNTSATGDFSTSLGTNASTNAQRGSFIFGDGSTTFTGAVIGNDAPNQFMVRAAGGYKLFSNAALSAGAQLAPGGSSWASLSDANAKENFRDVDGEDLLAKLARIPIREWNYKAQDAAIRHMGPTAQDFRAAFGLGDFPLRINTIDADGVALAGVNALEARTRAMNERLSRQNEELKLQLAGATADIAALRDQLAGLERLVTGRR